MFDKAINPMSLQDFKAHLHGELIVPGDDTYDSARRVWNGVIDKYPAAIVRCADVSAVVSAVQFARCQELEVAVRGGGHSYSGNGTCDGGLVIDLSRMKRVQVDPEQCIAWAQAGLTIGEFVRETQAFGLATPVGNVSATGLAGLTLGGGLGWLMGKYGLTLDNLLAVKIVTAEGKYSQPMPMSTRIYSGECAVEVATSVLSPTLSSNCTRSVRYCRVGRLPARQGGRSVQ